MSTPLHPLITARRARRHFIHVLGIAGGALFTSPGLFAELLTPTPRLTEGPFYPDKLPLDTDNDLIILNDAATPALGEIVHLSGRILTGTGAPVRNAVVEIWQVDHHGVYLHTRDSNNNGKRDANFQGYGRFLTDASGAYYFRTIKPVTYPGRAPHIHFGVSRNGKRIYTTQLLIKGHPQNEGDFVYKNAGDDKSRGSLLVEFNPLAGSPIGELTANFDIILGFTPEDSPDGKIHGGIGKSDLSRRKEKSPGAR
jgi:protocatechuate 3,4-dioxygenase beta subunit